MNLFTKTDPYPIMLPIKMTTTARVYTDDFVNMIDSMLLAGTNTFLEDPNCWIKGFTCRNLQAKCATPLTRRHIIQSLHYHMDPGDKVSWPTKKGNVFEAVIGDSVEVGDDIYISVLDRELPLNQVEIPWILGEERGMPESGLGGRALGFPIMQMNRDREALVAELAMWYGNKLIKFGKPAKQSRTAYYKNPDNGDSGCTQYMLGNKLIALGHNSGGYAGPCYSQHASQIQAACDQLLPGYKLKIHNFPIRRYTFNGYAMP